VYVIRCIRQPVREPHAGLCSVVALCVMGQGLARNVPQQCYTLSVTHHTSAIPCVIHVACGNAMLAGPGAKGAEVPSACSATGWQEVSHSQRGGGGLHCPCIHTRCLPQRLKVPPCAETHGHAHDARCQGRHRSLWRRVWPLLAPPDALHHPPLSLQMSGHLHLAPCACTTITTLPPDLPPAPPPHHTRRLPLRLVMSPS
jgi:hypothetical protein